MLEDFIRVTLACFEHLSQAHEHFDLKFTGITGISGKVVNFFVHFDLLGDCAFKNHSIGGVRVISGVVQPRGLKN